MADEAARLRVIEGGGAQPESRKATKTRTPSGKAETERLHVCPHCNVSALVRLRLGAYEVNGKLKGGAEHWCCAKCFRPYYLIKAYD